MDPITGLPSSRRSTLSGGDVHREGLTTETHDWTLVKAIDLVIDQKVIVIDGEIPIEEACDILTQNNISSAPVYDASTNSYSGMFDWADVMTYLLIVLKKKDAMKQQEKSDAELSAEFNDLVKLANIYKFYLSACCVADIDINLIPFLDLSKKNPFYSVLPETSLLQVVELFGSGTHRDNNGLSSIAIVDSEGLLIGNISMTDIKDRYPVFDVRPTSTLGYTIAKLSATKAHRLWVVDERMRAI
ncbi:20077_t:CDS:2, partial [Racocetra fulgida]